MEVTVAGRTVSIADDLVQGDVTGDVQRYLDGDAVDFSSYRVDLSGLTAFQQQVVEAIRAIPYGETDTYGALAERIDRGDAVRAVAGACGANPVPIVIPCHRVVAVDGPGGYAHGVPVKEALLALEAADA